MNHITDDSRIYQLLETKYVYVYSYSFHPNNNKTLLSILSYPTYLSYEEPQQVSDDCEKMIAFGKRGNTLIL